MAKDAKARKTAALATPTDLGANATKELTGGLNILLADVYALYLKTKNFHWHVSGPHFRDYHLLLDDQATQIDGMADPIAERVRKLGGNTIRSIGHIKKLQRVLDKRLASTEYAAGDAYTIADIAIFPWTARHEWHTVNLADFPNVKRWYDAINARPAVTKGMAVPYLN